METMEFDAARYLRNEEECRLYLEEMMVDGTPTEIQNAIAVVARALDIDIGQDATDVLKDGNAYFGGVWTILGALNMRLTVVPKSS